MICPYCKEEIKDGAIKCKHCGSNLDHLTSTSQSGHDFADSFSTSLDIWKNNLADLIILSLVFLLVCWIPIANIGFITGYTRSLIKVTRGEGRAQVGDIFNNWDCFADLFIYLFLYLLAAVILHSVPVIGSIASIGLSFLIVPGVYAIIDRKKGAIDAFKWSITTIRTDFVNWGLVYLVGNLLVFAGFAILFIGVVVTAPLGQLLIINQYERCKSA